MQRHSLPSGIVSVVQTPFLANGAIDEESFSRLVESAINGGAHGFLAPGVASEVESLTISERERIVQMIIDASAGRMPLVVGASSDRVDESVAMGVCGERLGAVAFLVSVPARLRAAPPAVLAHFETLASRLTLPLVVQDLDWTGTGLSLDTICRMADRIPTFVGLKIETVPAGPKYTAVRELLGNGFYLAGGWAVPQMIEALDRGVDALMPETSMVPVYSRIDALHRAGRREAAQQLFRELLPVLAYTNQEIRTSIAFFKELLVRKGIFSTAVLRGEPFDWDPFNRRIAAELIEMYLALESRAVRDIPLQRGTSMKARGELRPRSSVNIRSS